MLKSMTGFGRAENEISFGKVEVEISSINRKFLDIFLHQPKEFSELEIEIKKLISSKISRGAVKVNINFYPKEEIKTSVDVLKRTKDKWEKIAKDLNIDASDINLSFLIEQSKEFSKNFLKLSKSEKEAFLSIVKKAVEKTLEMKIFEAKQLEKDFLKRIDKIEDFLTIIDKKFSLNIEKFKKKILEKIHKLKLELDENRLLTEILILSEKIDISEEIFRISSHLKQFINTMTSKENSSGKKLDFICQEILRETNTIAAKCIDSEISIMIVDIKTELEKIREQVQNIE